MNKVVFISGLHRSGTSILHRIIRSSNDVSGFEGTGVPEDEGQHLQTVYKSAKAYGGPGRFSFHKNAKLNEYSELINPDNKARLLLEWGSLWDTSKSVWVEKSPPNIIRTRFLQQMFPNAYFITITRNPIAVSLATRKWSNTSLSELVSHWITAHKIYEEDRRYLERELLISYECLCLYPMKVIGKIEKFLDIKIEYNGSLFNKNPRYFNLWDNKSMWKFPSPKAKNTTIRKYEYTIRRFGYSMVNVNQFPNLA